MSMLARALAQITYGDPVAFANLTMVPLVSRTARDPWYVTADEALETGRFRVTEVSEAGHVPELRVVNDLDQAVLLLDGEELVGAKQNRVVNLTILVPARATLTIPVSCVEAGRWHAVSDDFMVSRGAMFPEARAHKLAQVSASMASGAEPLANQADVWHHVARRAADLGVRSVTSAMRDIYEQQRQSIDEFVKALPAVEDQVGAAFAIGERFAGVELFDASRTLFRLLPKIVSSYALDARVASTPPDAHGFSASDVAAWLERLAPVPPQAHPAVGMGTSLRWNGQGFTAAALAVGEILVHFVAFPFTADAGSGGRRQRMQAASRRRARWAR
jgi:hypothetical protein